VMGSHGRAENHFCTDQDHGMILGEIPPGRRPEVDLYFQDLGTRVTEALSRIGLPPCEGGVMISNPDWRKTLAEWQAQVSEWCAQPDAVAVRQTTIFYDFAALGGDASLAAQLRTFVTREVRRDLRLLRKLFTDAAHHKVPLTLFKGFVTEKSGPHRGQIDIKASGLRFVAECARILALLHGVTQLGTMERIEELERLGVVPKEEGRFVRSACECFFRLLFASQAEEIRAGAAPDNYLSPSALPIEERYLLRLALEATDRFQTLVHARIHTPFVPGLAPSPQG